MLLASVSTVSADTFIYEQRDGSHTGFNINAADTTANPIVSSTAISSYASGDHTSLDGYIGRYVYTGSGTTLEVQNQGVIPDGQSAESFYYTWNGYMATREEGIIFLVDNSSWRRVFYTARVKGIRHDDSVIDINGVNTLITSSLDTIDLTDGAGNETVGIGEDGYDASGNPGVYDGTNGYSYLYPYRSLYFDLAVIRVDESSNLGSSNFFKNLFKSEYKWYKDYYNESLANQIVYYKDTLTMKGGGISQVLALEGFQIPGSETEVSAYTPPAYSFSIEKRAPDLIPFNELRQKTALSNSYLAGYLRFSSTDVSGTVGFYADPIGTSTDFTFTATVNGDPTGFGYYVIFDPEICENDEGPVRVDLGPNSFATKELEDPVLINGEYQYQNILTGEISIMIDPLLDTHSIAAAVYESTIYAIFTAD